MFLARRNLAQNWTRLALSVAGVALAMLLILLLVGLRAGLYRQAAAYLDHAPGSVVVAQAGVSNFLATASLLPPGTTEAARQVAGVATVTPIVSQVIIYDYRGVKQSAYLVGYDPALGGGPWQLVAGREPRTDSDVVVDLARAQLQGVALGDTLDLMGRRFTVVGLSAGTITWTGSFLFVRTSALATLLLAPDATSYLLVTPVAGVPPEVVRDRLGALPGTSVHLKRDVIANDRKLLGRIFDAPLKLMVGIAFLVGTLVVGLVTYTATIERQREYGVLKALGARDRFLYQVVTVQALMAAGVGALAGVGLAFAGARLIVALRPQFLVALAPATIAQALAGGLVMALLGALFPARVIAALAPAEVFRR